MLAGIFGDLAKNPIIKPLVNKITAEAQLRQFDLNTPEGRAEAITQITTEGERPGASSVLITAVLDGRPVLAVGVFTAKALTIEG